MATIHRLANTGILQTVTNFDEISYTNKSRFTANNIISRLDEVTKPGPKMRTANTGITYVSNYFDEMFQKIITSGLLLNFDAGNSSSYSGSGTTWTDLSEFGNNGTLVGSPTYSSLNSGYLNFNGSTQYVTTNYNQTNVISYSIGVWFSTTATNADGVLVQNRGVASTSGKSLTLGLSPYINASGSLGTASAGRLFFAADTDGALESVCTNSSFNDGQWHYVLATFNRASGNVDPNTDFEIYVDGVLQSVSSTSAGGGGVSVPLTGIEGTTMAKHFAWMGETGGPSLFNGKIATIQIYNKKLSSDLVQHNYNALKYRYT